MLKKLIKFLHMEASVREPVQYTNHSTAQIIENFNNSQASCRI